jgi:hypothetical protein
MSFAKQASEIVTDRVACLLLAKEAEAVVIDPDRELQDEATEDEVRKSKRNRLLWALGGLAALGGGGYLAHRTGMLDAIGDKFRSKNPDTQPGVLQRGAEAVSQVPATASLALGALNASRGSRRISEFLPTGPRALRRHAPGNPADSLHGTLGMADQLREDVQRTPTTGAGDGIWSTVSGNRERAELRDRMHRIFEGLPKGTNQAQLADRFTQMFDRQGAAPTGLQEVLWNRARATPGPGSMTLDDIDKLERTVADTTRGGRFGRLFANRHVDQTALRLLEEGLQNDIAAAKAGDATAKARIERVAREDMGFDPKMRAKGDPAISEADAAEKLRGTLRQFRTLPTRPGRSVAGVLRRGLLPLAITHGVAPVTAGALRWSGLDAQPAPKPEEQKP